MVEEEEALREAEVAQREEEAHQREEGALLKGARGLREEEELLLPGESHLRFARLVYLFPVACSLE